MKEGRTLPLLGPALALYLTVELIAKLEQSLDAGAVLAITLGILGSLLPLVLTRSEEVGGTRRLSLVASLSGLGLIALVRPGTLSLPLELAGAVTWPAASAWVVDLALDTPDRPPGLARARMLRGAVHAASIACVVLEILLVLPPPSFGGSMLLVPASLSAVSPAVILAQLIVALAVRTARRRLGSTPEALAASGWALLGTGFAIAGGAVASAAEVLDLPESGTVVRGAIAASSVALVLGHLAMLDARRPIHAARAARHVVAATITAFAFGAAAVLALRERQEDTGTLAVAAMALLVVAAFAHRLVLASIEWLFAPDSGRLLAAIREAERDLRGARNLEEIGAGLLPPLRRAARSSEARPLLQTLAPARQVVIDAAGLPKVDPRELAPALTQRLVARPGEIIVFAPLRAMVVRRPDLRALVDALEQLEALCVVPITAEGELEGALVIGGGVRRAPLTLEEIAALERLGALLAGLLAMEQREARARERAGQALLTGERLEERIDALEDEVEKLRHENAVLKIGRVTERSKVSAIAYSGAMRSTLARLEELAALDAPVQIVAESGSDVETIARLAHAAGRTSDGPFVVADCASIRPEQTMAALFGIETAAETEPGWIRLAGRGTLLLLDVPALSLEAQAALAEAIATRAAQAEGARSSYAVEPRLIVHARTPVTTLASTGTFDGELARRLDPICLRVPPLRERSEDLPSLVLLALDRACRSTGRPVLGIDDAAMGRLLAHDWPGNGDELQWVIDHAAARATAPRVTLGDLPRLPAEASGRISMEIERSTQDIADGSWIEIEQRVLRAALARSGGNKSEAARRLGLARTTFLDKLRRAGLEASAESEGSTAA